MSAHAHLPTGRPLQLLQRASAQSSFLCEFWSTGCLGLLGNALPGTLESLTLSLDVFCRSSLASYDETARKEC